MVNPPPWCFLGARGRGAPPPPPTREPAHYSTPYISPPCDPPNLSGGCSNIM